MKKILVFVILVILGVGAFYLIHRTKPIDPNGSIVLPSMTETNAPQKGTFKKLDVLYVNEAPSGNWTGPWKNACEEATIAMVEYYYQDRKSVTIKEAEAFMAMLFEKQNALYGSNVNSDAVQFKNLVDNFTSFKAEIIRNPTVEQIKKEIDEERPVMSLHYGFDLKNKNIPFLATGTSYHAMVIIGYDDGAKQFIVNDDGDTKAGAGHRYGYDLFMNSLHEYNYATKKADGPATVLFTASKD